MPSETTSANLIAISRIIENYSLDAIKQCLQLSPNEIQLRIGFVGEFSSGKSTLINAVIGREILPSRDSPTTARIIQIETDLQAREPQRLSRDGDGHVRPVDAVEFDAIAQGMSSGMLILRVPPGAILQPGIQLIDSPGINSMLAGHSDLTIAQLSLLDGLVICLHAQLGSVPATVQQFLARSEIQAIAGKLLFVITCADQKSPESIQNIRSHIAGQLASILPSSEGMPTLTLARAKDALEQQTDGIAEFSQSFREMFIARVEGLRVDRHAIHVKQVAAMAQTAVRAYLDAISFDDADIKRKIDEAEAQIAKLEVQKHSEHVRLTDWYLAMRKDLLATSAQFGPALARAQGAEVDAVMVQLEVALSNVADKHIKTYAKDSPIAVQGLPPSLSAALTSGLKAHAKYVESGVTLVTLAVAAGLTAGAGATAAVAGEAAAGVAAGQVVAANAAKQVAQVAGKQAVVGAFKSLMAKAATTVTAINPVEMLGDFVRIQWNDNDTSTQLPQMAVQLAELYRADMLRHLDDTCFRPTERELLAAENGLREARKERTTSINDAAARKEQAMSDLRTLDAILATKNADL